MTRSPLRRLRYLIEAAFIFALYGFFALLPTDAASAVGGWIGRTVGPRLGATRKARRNLARALPELSLLEQNRLLTEMWDNLGRIMAEYPHLARFDESRVEIVHPERLLSLRESGRPLLIVSGHFANWEMLPVTATRRGLPTTLIYRHANNPYVDRLLRHARAPGGPHLVPKGVAGARSAHGTLRRKGAVGMLIDQKHNRGLPIPFFGRPAMTATAVAELADRYRAFIVPLQVERRNGAHFRITVTEPLDPPPGTPTATVLEQLNQRLESWVRQRPGQWLWLHRRWGD